MGQHPEFLEGYDLITSEYPGVVERLVDRTVGGITMWTQNATGNTEIEQETYHSIHEREAFDHTQYNQDEWAGRQIADAADRRRSTPRSTPQEPNPDTHQLLRDDLLPRPLHPVDVASSRWRSRTSGSRARSRTPTRG